MKLLSTPIDLFVRFGLLGLWCVSVPGTHAQEGLAPLQAALSAKSHLVVFVDVEDDQLAALEAQFEIHSVERITRSRSRVRLIVERAHLDSVREMGVRVGVDEAATRELEARRTDIPQGRDPESSSGSLVGSLRASGAGITNYPCYRTVEETYADLDALALNNPDLAAWIDVGDSLIKQIGPGSGYDINALKISDGNATGPKAPFVILAATHAREYATAEAATRFGEHLVNNFGIDPDVTAFLRHVEVWIMPVHNPDGRKIAEADATKSKRKNERDVGCAGIAQGVDLNRNSEQYFRYDCMAAGECTTGLGYSTSTCNDLYTGPDWPNVGAEDPEPETTAINDLMATAFTQQWTPEPPDDAEGLFISIHSHGRYVLFPWEARWNDPPNFVGLRTLGRRLGHRLPGYKVCQDCFGTASGTNVDEAYGRYGVAAYTFELGTAFHQSCTGSGTTFEDDVWPIALDALMLGLKAARRPYLEPGGPEIHSLSWSSTTFSPGEQLPIAGTADDTRVDWDAGAVTGTDAAAQPEHDISAVFYSIDLPPWDPSATLFPLAPVDSFDSSVEPFSGTVDTSGLGVGTHIVWLAAEDSSGQMGVASAVLVELKEEIFADGFETGTTSAWMP